MALNKIKINNSEPTKSSLLICGFRMFIFWELFSIYIYLVTWTYRNRFMEFKVMNDHEVWGGRSFDLLAPMLAPVMQ